jgi:hypothetical protein
VSNLPVITEEEILAEIERLKVQQQQRLTDMMFNAIYHARQSPNRLFWSTIYELLCTHKLWNSSLKSLKTAYSHECRRRNMKRL